MSAVTYLPQTDSDIVTLACWAMNAVGRQSLPCLIHVLPARKYNSSYVPYSNINCSWRLLNHKPSVYLMSTGVPEPPRLCELRNDSSLEVVCQPGYDGGLQQHFVLEAVGATSMYFNNLDSTRSTHEILDNEISTMNDQVRTFLSRMASWFREGNVYPGECNIVYMANIIFFVGQPLHTTVPPVA